MIMMPLQIREKMPDLHVSILDFPAFFLGAVPDVAIGGDIPPGIIKVSEMKVGAAYPLRGRARLNPQNFIAQKDVFHLRL
jgi:hypothetical protein